VKNDNRTKTLQLLIFYSPVRSRSLGRTRDNLVAEDEADLRIAGGTPAELREVFNGARTIVAREGARGDVVLECPREMARVAHEEGGRIAVHQIRCVIGRVARRSIEEPR
jgi:hypothetical protein